MPQLSVDAIDILGGERQDSEDQRDSLYLSIKEHGLLQPIMVCPNEEVPGRYSLVFGRRRLSAVRRLQWGMIDCTVKTMNDLSKEMVEIAENLHRLDLTAAQRDAQIARYMELYAAQHPELVVDRRKAAVRNKLAPSPSGEEVGPAKTSDIIVAAAAKEFGVSPRSVWRAASRAKKFTDEERKVLDVRGMEAPEIQKLADIPDDISRKQVVLLLAANMDFDGAMREVLGDGYATAGDVAMDDDEYCETVNPRLWKGNINQAKFKGDVLRYRRWQKAREAFLREIAWGAEKKLVDNGGIYFRRATLFLNAAHPRDWIACGGCVRGMLRDGEHGDCKGGGYLIPMQAEKKS